jgi:DnaK suppressor protein
VRKGDLKRCRNLLLGQREQILGHVGKALSEELHVDRDDFPDEIDLAVSEGALSLTGRIRERERGLLNKIEDALEKIVEGTYGECTSCGEEIELRRLLARPVAGLCIGCKGELERLERQMD